MKRILIVFALVTGIVTVLIWAAPVSARHIFEQPYNSRKFVFESQMICIAAPEEPPPDGPPQEGEAPEETPCENCGGEVWVISKGGQTYVEFDFTTPFPDEEYYLYMGRNYLGDYQEIQFGEIVWDDSEFPPTISDIVNPIVVTTDEDGECHTEPILLDPALTGFPPGFEIHQATFSVKSKAVIDYVLDHPTENILPGCGDYLSTGFRISE